MNRLKISQFGNPLLRETTKNITNQQIVSAEIQTLILDMRKLLKTKKLGIGLAAPQIGKSLNLAIVEIQKTQLRNNVEEFSLVIINPKITNTYGRKTQIWEGCISAGEGKANLFAKVPRYKKIELTYLNENAELITEIFTGLPAHVLQHEVDHLNGILFVDKVKDSSTYMTYSEYKKMKKKEEK